MASTFNDNGRSTRADARTLKNRAVGTHKMLRAAGEQELHCRDMAFVFTPKVSFRSL